MHHESQDRPFQRCVECRPWMNTTWECCLGLTNWLRCQRERSKISSGPKVQPSSNAGGLKQGTCYFPSVTSTSCSTNHHPTRIDWHSLRTILWNDNDNSVLNQTDRLTCRARKGSQWLTTLTVQRQTSVPITALGQQKQVVLIMKNPLAVLGCGDGCPESRYMRTPISGLSESMGGV